MSPRLLASVLSAAATMAPALAGPLTPPAGPVAPTHKTMFEVEPRTPISQATTPGDEDSVFKVTQPGSYYLTANLAGQDAKAGIEIATGGVTIDLAGFSLEGVGGSFDGIRSSVANLPFITITDGIVVGWAGDGIDLGTEPAASCRIEGVSVGHCGRTGILAGPGAVIERCTARACNLNAVFNLAGIQTGAGSTVAGCASQFNQANGIVAGAGSIVSGCAAHSNTGDGIRVASGSTVTACAAHSNTGSGIAAPPGPVGRNGDGVLVTGCSAHSNTVAGVTVIGGSIVERCTARGNGVGITTGLGRCVFRANLCSSNTGAGIAAGDTENIIDGNTCLDNATGVHASFGGSLIVRNTCAGNTTANWSIAPNNRLGPIVLCQVNPAQITTSGAAPGTLTTADPFANFSY